MLKFTNLARSTYFFPKYRHKLLEYILDFSLSFFCLSLPPLFFNIFYFLLFSSFPYLISFIIFNFFTS